MDILLVKNNSIRIRGNTTTVVTDPISKVEAQIVLLTNGEYDLSKVEGTRLVIEGPGEYEIGGLSVVAKRVKENLIFDIADQSRVLIAPASAVSGIQGDDEYDAILIKLNEKINTDSFSSLNAKSFILYGDLNLLTLKNEEVIRTNKVNLKKTNEVSGKIILLS